MQLGVPWNSACSGDIFLKVCQLKQLVDERHCSLAEAKKKLDAKDGATPTINPVTAMKPLLICWRHVRLQSSAVGTSARSCAVVELRSRQQRCFTMPSINAYSKRHQASMGTRQGSDGDS